MLMAAKQDERGGKKIVLFPLDFQEYFFLPAPYQFFTLSFLWVLKPCMSLWLSNTCLAKLGRILSWECWGKALSACSKAPAKEERERLRREEGNIKFAGFGFKRKQFLEFLEGSGK